MGTHFVVVRPPFLDDVASSAQRQEPVLGLALIPKLAVEALHEYVLDGLSRLAAMELHPTVVGPTGELRPVVHNDRVASRAEKQRDRA